MTKIKFLLLFLITTVSIQAQTTYILCGKLVDTKEGVIKQKQTIIVEKNKIINVINGYVAPKSKTAKTIDLKNKVVIPGLILICMYI